ncbi:MULTISPECIES: FAD-binding oxidoreductase [unclassified Granulicatella]|uniref:NAD(P)/FAD-dependent oxidoreductase n=1 Tax=unclassified Granulicatella TaxID=2630493 RepID=UPI0010748DAA|nr:MULTISPECIES: FAD-binding oxidoreductase [unclassified Granulicatella]MBF0780327.1 FAD-binding oxidoreductase [Granulicatella sp. 19428wC4_WM01]TFU95554.1 FAD-binding oxidoreductase [Granulicatella sp. WM01]
MKHIAIIGGGIVGSTAAFYLAKNGHTVHLYDESTGQATKAAAGIISPWLSQRRNKVWYRLTANGAAFYQTLLKDLTQLGLSTDFYQQNGTLVFKKSEKLLQKITQLAQTRLQDDAMIGTLKQLDIPQLNALIPELHVSSQALFASGGALIDGRQFIKVLRQASAQFNFSLFEQRVALLDIMHKYDTILLAVGAWLPHLLHPLGFEVDVRAQKGQLFAAQLSNTQTDTYPVIMPQSEIDLLPFKHGKWVIGATHEDDMGFDLTVDLDVLERMKQEASIWLPELQHIDMTDIRVGTRAYTSDYTPFFGLVPTLPHVYVASGLGASGLTSGPYIAYLLSQLINGQSVTLDLEPYSPKRYIHQL